LYQSGQERFFDIPENKMSEIFERFLRNFLAEQLTKAGFDVDSRGFINWVLLDKEKKAVHMPRLRPDVVIWRKRVPKFVIDAKFYKKPVYRVEPWYRDENEGKDEVKYKTHSHNLYQLITYTDYLNCNGLLVYAQTESGVFEEFVTISPEYYEDKKLCRRSFGFTTLDLSGEFEAFKERASDLAKKIEGLCC
jgi:5-methylcytosine-specific restriction endonuclease McrBC regulatory subunit McrC